MKVVYAATLLLLACGNQDPPCATGLELCGSACADLASDNHNCGVCGNVCPSYGNYCISGACKSQPATCEPPSSPCFNEHGFGGCCGQNQVCVGNPMMVQCVPSCTSNSDCTTGCCTIAHTCGTCFCTASDQCLSGACAPQTNSSGDPVGPMSCKPNDGALYDGCNGTTTCSSGCCVADSNGNHFCASACVDSSTCGAGHCNSYDFSVGTCAGPTACGP